ncbi:Ribose-5-phosphate isomerase B [bioreactor metagenome]|uniref:Ribose-5-phosphate isomerase B n=1 Tax=bioreactor metagenome TaxID=1076179 RepID=A0A644ZNJ6_9ZZZZ
MIALGSDHGGYELKELIKEHLKNKNVELKDFGTDSPQSCDYPKIAKTVGQAVAAGECETGILICGTGIGMSIAANKIRGIRAACCSDTYSARLSRLHNNANVLCFGQRVVGYGLALDIVDSFLSSEFEGGRHQRRIGLIDELEKN